jgi:hypothetical protein
MYKITIEIDDVETEEHYNRWRTVYAQQTESLVVEDVVGVVNGLILIKDLEVEI